MVAQGNADSNKVRPPIRPRTVGGLKATVEEATLRELATAAAGSWKQTSEDPLFPCTECGDRAAVPLSDARWRCRSCRFTGTVYALQFAVLSNAEYAENLFRLRERPFEHVPSEDAFEDVWAGQ